MSIPILRVGDVAPPFALPDQHSKVVSLSDFAGRRLCLYFYPKADTPGCTQQSCLLRDLVSEIGNTAIVGISPDKSAKLAKFDNKYSLGFSLLADTEHTVAEAFGVWKEKMLYGKTYMGIERSSFLIGVDGRVEQAWYKISPRDTPVKLLEALS
jgi:thioredoxin-dependent peroxiredoxin